MNVLREIINDCKQIHTKNEENIILEALRLSQYFFVCTSFLYLSTAAFFIISPALNYNSENREFVLQSAFPFEAEKSPAFEIIFLIQSFTTFVGSFGNAFIDGLFIMMVSTLKDQSICCN